MPTDFLGVVVWPLRAVLLHAIGLAEDGNKPRRVRQVRLVFIRAQWSQRLQPLRRHPAVTVLTPHARRLLECSASTRVRNRHERPRLLMGSTGSCSSGSNRQFNRLAWQGPSRNGAWCVSLTRARDDGGPPRVLPGSQPEAAVSATCSHPRPPAGALLHARGELPPTPVRARRCPR